MRGRGSRSGSVAPDGRRVVGRDGEPRVVLGDGDAARLLLADEADLVAADEDGARAPGYLGPVTMRPFPLLAALLLVAGELEVALAGGGAVSAVAVPAMALPVAWARRAPLVVPAAVALVLLVQAALGGMLVGDSVTTILVLAVTLYAAGRYAEGTSGLAGAAAVAVVLAAIRVGFDAVGAARARGAAHAARRRLPGARRALGARPGAAAARAAGEGGPAGARPGARRPPGGGGGAGADRRRPPGRGRGRAGGHRARRGRRRSARWARARSPPRASGWARSAPPRAPRWPTCGGCWACCATTASRRGSLRPAPSTAYPPPRVPLVKARGPGPAARRITARGLDRAARRGRGGGRGGGAGVRRGRRRR